MSRWRMFKVSIMIIKCPYHVFLHNYVREGFVMFDEKTLRGRVERFQRLMRDEGTDASMIRTLSSFRYFTGVKWLRPALLIPADGDPTAFVFEHEAEELAEMTWIGDIKTWRRAEELMRGVSGSIRQAGYKAMGLDYSVERDAYILFYELFKRLNPMIEVRDVHSLIMKLRMIKDSQEIDATRRASRIVEGGIEAAVEAVKIGATELEIAGQAMMTMMKMGSENPHVYVNSGPRPRVHAEPRPWVRVGDGHVVSLVLSADYEGYYSNISRTVFVGEVGGEKRRSFDVVMELNRIAEESLKHGIKLVEIERRLEEAANRRGCGDYYACIGFTHGVGLLTEEDPITTIVAPHRQYTVEKGMTLALVHAPLTVPGLGSVKIEDTYTITGEGAEKMTQWEYWISR